MKDKEIREIILKELPNIIEQDREVQQLILRLSKDHFADKEKTEDRFDKILKELAEDRETQNRKWEEQDKKWQENVKRWDEQDRWWQENVKRWDEQDKKWQKNAKRWEEQNTRWQEQAKRWDEHDKRWEEQDRKWEDNQKVIHEMLESIKVMNRKYDSTIGALGARWGLRSEQSFRNALRGILGEVSKLEVINVVEYDEDGEIFGHPEQVELDLIIKHGMLMICEIKSSMSKADIYIFQKKAAFYQKKHSRKAQRLIVISPMVDKNALELAKNLGIKVYSYVEDIEPDIFLPA